MKSELFLHFPQRIHIIFARRLTYTTYYLLLLTYYFSSKGFSEGDRDGSLHDESEVLYRT